MVGFEGGDSNLYVYSLSDPVNAYDPDGRIAIDAASFPAGPEGQQLLANLRLALSRLTGSSGHDDEFPRAPRKLRQERDNLSDDFRKIWKNSVIRFDPNCNNPGSHLNADGGADIVLGPFLLEKQFTRKGVTRELEKVVLHEYLHQALDQPFQFTGQPDRNQLQHGFIDQVIQFNLKYPGSPNPGAP